MPAIKVFVNTENLFKAAKGEEFEASRSNFLTSDAEMTVPFKYVTGMSGDNFTIRLAPEDLPFQRQGE